MLLQERGWRRGAMIAVAAVTASLAAGAAPGQAATARAGAQTAVTTAPAADQVQAPIPTLSWGKCQGLPGPFQCTTAKAPLDYDQPNGPTVTLDLLRVRAKDQSRKLGTLFVNPGGPGGSSRGFATVAGQLLGTTVQTRYDVVGIDPRGVGPSSQMVCRNDTSPPQMPRESFPITWTQAQQVWRFAEWTRSACTKDPGRIVRHMSTADTARDMDLIRQAVGDTKLHYYGISYGTYLGSTYASMFPSRVGRLVVDGVLDPVAWSTGDSLPATVPFTTRLRSAKGASEGLVAALHECDRLGKKACSFAGDANAKWLRLVERARAGKLTFGGHPFIYSDLIGATLGFLYSNSYEGLDDILQSMYEENFGGSGQRSSAGDVATFRAAAKTVITAPFLAPAARGGVVNDAFLGVACADSRNPESLNSWWQAGQNQDKKYPWFGSLWTWAGAPCAKWPITTKQDTYWGPFGGPTANPILVVGNTYDPATPIHGARKVASLFDSARLLTYRGWGHGALGTKCVTKAYDRYFATGALPAVGATCAPDAPLFGGRGA